jgi:hypothetical protein
MLPLRFSNSSNIASCLLLMTSKASDDTVAKIIRTSKAVWYRMVEFMLGRRQFEAADFAPPVGPLKG